MARHQGTYKPDKAEIPFELSRSKIEDFIKCKACFWLEKVRGVKRPAIPGFNINTNTDTLLKRDFDSVRGEKSHPFLINNGLGHLIPFDHDNLELWTQSMHFGLPGRFNTLHKETNILFGGGIDDIYQNKETGELHVVDYKSTANLSKNPTRVSLEGKWKESYKRQADMYTWVLRRKGFAVSDPTGQDFFHKEEFRILVDVHFGHLLQVRGFLQDQGTGIEFQKRTISDF